MNKQVKNITLIAMALALSGCVASSPSKTNSDVSHIPASESTAGIEIMSRGITPVSTANGLPSVTFEGSQRLTDALQDMVAANGYTLYETSSESQVMLSAVYKASGRVGNVNTPVAELFNKSLTDNPQALEDEVSNGKRNRISMHGGIASVGQSMTGSSLAGIAFSAVTSTLIDMNGISGGFNKAVVGDPRGVCLFGCSNWNKVQQVVELTITIKQSGEEKQIPILAKAFDERLLPGELTNAAIKHYVSKAFPATKPILQASTPINSK